jgi:hypothetical protein
LDVYRPVAAPARSNDEIVADDSAFDVSANLDAAAVSDFTLKYSVLIDEEYAVTIVHWISPFRSGWSG